MKILYRLMPLLLLVFIMSCSSVTVKTDFDPEYDFSTFKTYRWASAKELNPNDELAQHPLIQKRVMAAVDKTLTAKGMQKVESGDADVVVVAHAESKERMQVTQTGGGYYHPWYNPWWGPYGGSTYVSYYEQGTLVLDIVSWKTKELAWRGMGTSILKDYSDSEEMQKDLDVMVAKIMADYPPARGAGK